MRTIRTRGAPVSVAASADCFAAAILGQVLVFALDSGELIQTFGVYGAAEGQLDGSLAARFTPGGRFLIAEHDSNHRLSVFSGAGEFLRCIGVGALKSPTSTEFAPNGDVLVADRNNRRIAVFSPDGSALLRSFGNTSGQLGCPTKVAVHGGQLFVLDVDHVHVYR